MNNDSDGQSLEAILVCLFDEDIQWCDKIVNDLNEKHLPGLNSKRITVRKLTVDNLMKESLVNYDDIKNSHREQQFDSGIFQATSSIQHEEKKYKSYGLKNNILKSKTTQSASLDNKLLNELKKLREDKFCTNCRKNEKTIMFLPCSHLVLCLSCSSNDDLVDRCSICHKKVEATIKAYL